MKRHPYLSKKTHIYEKTPISFKKKPISMKRHPYLTKKTHIYEKTPISFKKDPYL